MNEERLPRPAPIAWHALAQEAVADGINSLEHIGSVFEFILPADTPRWPPPVERAAFSKEELVALERRVMEGKAAVDLNSPAVTALVEAIGQQLVQPNLYGEISPAILGAGIAEAVDDTTCIRDCILGTDIRAEPLPAGGAP